LDADAPVIKVMADYDCYPLWLTTPDGTSNLDPAELSIPDALARHLLDWADAYDATLNRDDPVASGFANPVAEDAFYTQGEELAHELAAHLSPRFTVTYAGKP
jgi:hypothetical protein